MNNDSLITLLSGCVAYLQAAQTLGVDGVKTVCEKLSGQLPTYDKLSKSDDYIRVGGTNEYSVRVPYPNAAEFSAGMHTNKFEAIKMYKNRTKESLMHSKQAIEKAFEEQGCSFKKHS